MAVSSIGAKDSPAAQLRSLIGRLGPAEQRLFRAVRTRMRKRLPTANELAYDYGTFVVIAYSATDRPVEGIVTITGRPTGVELYFMHGPQLPDPKKLLRGSGRQTRFIRLESARQVAHPDVEALIAAAVRKAGAPLPAEGGGKLLIRTFGGKQVPRRRLSK